MIAHLHHARANPHAERTVKGGLHPLVYRSIVGLTLWFVLSVWILFDRGAYVGLAFAMITVFFVIVVGIPVIIAQAWRRNTPEKDQRSPARNFHDWATRDFPTWTGPLSGSEAATQILLPIAAVCIGITIFGLVFWLAVPHAGR